MLLHYLSEWPKSTTLTTPNADKDVEQQALFSHCWWECKMVQPPWKTVWWFLTKLNIPLPYNPAIVLLGIYPKELKTYVHTKACTQMFIAALFIISKIWKKPRCPSVGEWINKLWYIQILEYSSALKTNALSSHKNTWRKLKCISLSERRQSEKATYCNDPNYMTFWKRQNDGDSKMSVVAGGGWRGKAHRFLGPWKYSIWSYDDTYMSLYICPNPQNAQHQKWTLR